MEPETSWFLVGFVNHRTTTGTPIQRILSGSVWLEQHVGKKLDEEGPWRPRLDLILKVAGRQ